MHSILVELAYLSILFSIGLASPIIGDECKVHIDNRHLELKGLIADQQKFDWNNWSHLILLLILGFLVCLLILAYCFIKLKIWPSIKHTHTSPSIFPRQKSPSVVEKPYIINLRDLQNATSSRVDPADEQ